MIPNATVNGESTYNEKLYFVALLIISVFNVNYSKKHSYIHQENNFIMNFA